MELTKEGQELFDKIFIKHAEDVEKFASALTKEEIETLSNLLKKLGKSLG